VAVKITTFFQKNIFLVSISTASILHKIGMIMRVFVVINIQQSTLTKVQGKTVIISENLHKKKQ